MTIPASGAKAALKNQYHDVASGTVVIKIGTAAMQDEKGDLDRAVLTSLVKDIAALKKRGWHVFLVSSGAVGLGRQELKMPKDQELSIQEKQLAASKGQVKLMKEYETLCAEHGLYATQMLLERKDFEKRTGHPRKALADYILAAKQNSRLLPIINENDVTSTQELKEIARFSDNDHLASLFARAANAEKLIILSHIDGIYTADPAADRSAQLIRKINFAVTPKDAPNLEGKSKTGRGGMLKKFESVAAFVTGPHRTAYIAKASEPKAVLRICAGKRVGTCLVRKSRKAQQSTPT